VYHNAFEDTQGWMRTSSAFAKHEGGKSILVQKKLGEGLGLEGGHNVFWVFRDCISGMQYIRSANDLCEGGLYLELAPYQAHVFLDFKKVYDSPETPYALLAAELEGKGVHSMYEALRELEFRPVLRPFGELINSGMINYLLAHRSHKANARLPRLLVTQIKEKLGMWHHAVERIIHGGPDLGRLDKEAVAAIKAVLALGVMEATYPLPRSRKYKAAGAMLSQGLERNTQNWTLLLVWAILSPLTHFTAKARSARSTHIRLEEWMLDKQIVRMLQELEFPEQVAWRQVQLLKALMGQSLWYQDEGSQRGKTRRALSRLLDDAYLCQYINVNEYEGVLWFNRESLQEILWWLLATAIVQITANPRTKKSEKPVQIVAVYDMVKKMLKSLAASEYQVDKLLEELA